MNRRQFLITLSTTSLVSAIPAIATASRPKTFTRLTLNNASAQRGGQSVTIVARLALANGAPLPYQPVRLWVGADDFGTRQSDKQGRAEFTLRVPKYWKPGNRVMQAEYRGNGIYAFSSDAATLRVT